jgi:tetratricopeptide (TPR) repeat protein
MGGVMKSILIAFLLLPVLFLYEALPQSTTSRKPRVTQEEPVAAPKDETRQRPTEIPDRTPRPVNNPTPVVTPPVEPQPVEPQPVYTPPAETPPSNTPPDEPVYSPPHHEHNPEPQQPEVIIIDRSPVIVEKELSPIDLFTEQGIEYFDEGYYADALIEFNNALEIDTTQYDLYYYRGCTLLKLEDYTGTVEDLDIYLYFFPEDKDALYNRGLAWFYLNDKNTAYLDFDAASKLGDKRAKSILRRFY